MLAELFIISTLWSAALSDLTSIYNYLGCYVEINPNTRLLNGFQQNFSDTLTPEVCISLCGQKGFYYAGTQNSTDCSCSKTKPVDDQKAIFQDDCKLRCSGDETRTCGGVNRLSIYRTRIKEGEVTGDVLSAKFLGCYAERLDALNLLDGIKKNFPHTLTEVVCLEYCIEYGFSYAGTQNRDECYCSRTRPNDDRRVDHWQCDMRCSGDHTKFCGGFKRLNIYKTWDKEEYTGLTTTASYMGCYREMSFIRLLVNYVQLFADSLTPEVCVSVCLEKGYAYAGTENRVECYCSKTTPLINQKAEYDIECNIRCSGDNSKYCGGIDRISVYKTGAQEIVAIRPTSSNYLGCFIEIPGRLMNDLQENMKFRATLTPEICTAFCLENKFDYAGAQFRFDCFCSKNKPPERQKASDDAQCNMRCSGDESKICGGVDRLSVYSTKNNTGNSPGKSTDIVEISTETTAMPITSCVQSVTTFNGKGACRGDVIFEDNFTNPLGNKWKHVVAIPELPDNEFVLLDADPKNSYVSRNNLVIKPTIFNDTFVSTGSLELQGCTAARGTRECGYQAFSYNILPPVASARINTRHSFTFRYGKVNIRAKLPVGDWLVPEIWFEPKYHRPGSEYYKSGRIRLAVSRGNQQLQCGEALLGRRRLASEVLMGPENDVRSRSVNYTIPDTWHDNFHTYTLIWKPDSISFTIDNGPLQELVEPGERLCEVFGFSSQQCQQLGSGSNLAPFNKEFYISLGLSVGSSRDFPDNCLNTGENKPWRNSDPKAMLNFWLDKQNWQSTWSDGKTSMLVRHVRVTAL